LDVISLIFIFCVLRIFKIKPAVFSPAEQGKMRQAAEAVAYGDCLRIVLW
jgi:hypothetical protein